MLTQIIKPVTGPITVTLEATWDVIHEHDLDWLNGEHFDTVDGVIAIEDNGATVRLVRCRTLEAYKRGEANAGRGEWEFTRKQLQCIYIDGTPVWGRPGN